MLSEDSLNRFAYISEISHIHEEKLTLHYLNLIILKNLRAVLTHENHLVSLLKVDSQAPSLDILVQ